MKSLVLTFSATCLLLLFNITFLYSQQSTDCETLAFNANNCEFAGYSAGGNCHGFVRSWMSSNYDTDDLDCSVNSHSCELQDAIQGAMGNYVEFYTLASSLTPASSSNHNVITYEERINGQWIVHHSALWYGGTVYVSKWETHGPLVKHQRASVPICYHQLNNPDYRIRYWNFDNFTGDTPYPIPPHCAPPTCTAPTLGFSQYCTSCSCDTQQGYFLVRATNGFSNHQWSVSGGSIAWNLGEYIYVNRPGGGFTYVFVTATDECGDSQSHSQSFVFPDCTGGGGGWWFQPTQGTVVLNLAKLLEQGGASDTETIYDNNKQVAIYGTDGRLVFQTTTNDISINISAVDQSIKPGVYVVHVKSGRQEVAEKIILH